MAQNETQPEAPTPWLDLDRPTLAQYLMLLAIALVIGGACGLLLN